MGLNQADFASWAETADPRQVALLRSRRNLTRRGFMVGAAGVAGAAATTSLWFPIVARAGDGGDDGSTVAPRPIPQTVAPGAPFHVVLPGPGNEPSSITDFQGTIGVAALGGTGVGIDAKGNVEFWPKGVFAEDFDEVKAIRAAQREKGA